MRKENTKFSFSSYMAKRFKLKISRVLVSFRLCRSKKASNLPEIPVPVIRRISPMNPKAFEAGYRNLINHPAPPPSTPDFSLIKRDLSSPKRALVTKEYKGTASSGCFSSRGVQNKETKTLISNPRSFQNASLFEMFDQSLAEDSHVETKKKKLNNTDMVKRLRSFGPLSLEKQRTVLPCTAEEKVRGSVAVVKISENPCEDFKRSMMEMIVEKHMFEANDLEQLLQCFLSLNSRQYHGIIVEVFTQIWEALFCERMFRNFT